MGQAALLPVLNSSSCMQSPHACGFRSHTISSGVHKLHKNWVHLYETGARRHSLLVPNTLCIMHACAYASFDVQHTWQVNCAAAC